jgi:hypothetical protein
VEGSTRISSPAILIPYQNRDWRPANRESRIGETAPTTTKTAVTMVRP